MRLLICALALWTTALLDLGPWALLAAPALVGLGFLCLRRHHHLGVLLIVFTCLFTIQTTMLGAARGTDDATSAEGIVVGHSQPGESGWSRLTVLTSTGITEVLSPSAPPDGARVSMRTEALEDIRISNVDANVLRTPNRLWQWRTDLRMQLREDSLASGHSGGALLPGLVVGDTGPQNARMEDDMRVVSLTHISAVSG